MNFYREVELDTCDARWRALTKLHPTPWRLERMNDHGVTVCDARGGIVLELEYAEQGPDMSNQVYEDGVQSDRAIALLLETMSLVETGTPFKRNPLV